MAYFGFHAFQSFAEGEVTPEIAHEIGVKLAEEMWGDRFEVIVSTHINTNHIHNHFCLNSVSFKDGKKYYNNRYTYAMLRETSDNLCREYNLSVLDEKPCGKYNIDYTKYRKEQTNRLTYYTNVKADIDYAIEQAYNLKDFANIMRKMNYEVINRSGKLSIKPFNRKRNIRIERAFGEEYTIENIDKRILETESVRVPFPEAKTLNGTYKQNSKNNKSLRKKKKMTGIRALYFHYCYLLKIYPNTRQVISKELREEINKMEDLSKEARLLSRTGIKTLNGLLEYKSSSITKIHELKSKREGLWRKRKLAKSTEEKTQIQEQIDEIVNQINNLKKEQKLIEDIESRIPKMKENMQEMIGKKKTREQEKNRERRNEFE